MRKELWKDIQEYEGLYQISNLGRIKSLDKYIKGKGGSKRFIKGRLLNPTLTRGYLGMCLCVNFSIKRFNIHRLVAQHFIPNPENKPQVNHINGIKIDNRVENLEWCTCQENIIHAFKNNIQIRRKGKDNPLYGKSNPNTSKKIIDIKTGKIFNSVKEAADYANIKRSTMSAMLINQNPNKTNLRYYNE